MKAQLFTLAALLAAGITIPAIAQDDICYAVDSAGNRIDLSSLCGGSGGSSGGSVPTITPSPYEMPTAPTAPQSTEAEVQYEWVTRSTRAPNRSTRNSDIVFLNVNKRGGIVSARAFNHGQRRAENIQIIIEVTDGGGNLQSRDSRYISALDPQQGEAFESPLPSGYNSSYRVEITATWYEWAPVE